MTTAAQPKTATAELRRARTTRTARSGVGLVAEPPWLTEVRLRAARRVLWMRQLWSGQRYGDEHLLAISHSEVDRAIAPATEAADAERAFYDSDPGARDLSAQIAGLAAGRPGSRLDRLAGTFGLAPMDLAVLSLCLAGAADHALARVFGYLLDDTQAADPTPALAAALYGLTVRRPPGPGSPLVRWLLATPVATGSDAFAWSAGWCADALLLPAVLDESDGAADWSAGCTARLVAAPPGPVLRPDAVAEITGFVRAVGSGLPVEIELAGPPGSGRTTLAAQVTTELGSQLVAVDAGVLAAGKDAVAAATREVRRALLDGSVIEWEHAELLAGPVWQAVPPAPLVFVSVPEPVPGSGGYRAIRRSVGCGPIGRAERLALWSAHVGTPAPVAVADWALRPAEIGLAAHAAGAGDDEVAAVCRRLLLASTPELASPLPLPYLWSDLVLPASTATHLREFEVQARHRGGVLDEWGFARLTTLGRGTTALFAGPSGTGKTMAAQVLARSLGLDLYRVDLAGVVSKYIGETEKHLRELFDACERAPVLLLFDEADALFGKRTQVSDAHDRYANIEIDYVLQRMEQFDGVAVLATNRKGDLDPAFTRRMRFIIDFVPPGAAEREHMWRMALDGAADAEGRPLTGPLDWARLGRDLDLTGAGIKSVALAAAFLAWTDGGPIAQRHVLAAARRELAKQGVVVRPSQAELAQAELALPGRESEPR